MVLHECPFCHKLLAGRLVSKAEVDSSEIAKETDFGLVPALGGGPHGAAVWPEDGIQRIVDHPEEVVAYKLNYKCKHCGKEWNKISVEKIDIPKEYVEDEEEETDYDAEIETREAREEEMAREQE